MLRLQRIGHVPARCARQLLPSTQQHARSRRGARRYNRPDGLRVDMLIAAVLAGVVTGALATFFFQRAARGRRAYNAGIESISARVGDIIETAMDPIITIDAQQRVVLFNSAAEKAFGWPRSAVVGQ